MKKNKKRDIVLSLLIAIALWSFVIYTTDPVRTKVVTNVPVQITGQELLDERGLTVVDPESVTIDIPVKASRSMLSSITSDGIHVTADVSEAVIGDNYLPIKVVFDKDVEPASDMARTVHIRIEKIVTEARKVKIVYADDAEKMAARLTSEDIVHVSGASSKVKEVASVSALLTADDISSGQADIETQLIPVDNAGNEVRGIELDAVKASIHLEGYGTKEVPLNVEVTGEPENGYEVVAVEKPDTVILSGDEETLAAIEEVTAKKINLAGLHATTSISIEAEVPEGVVIASGQTLVAKIVIAALSSPGEKTITISDIQFTELEDGYTAETDDVVTVTGKGITQSKVKVKVVLSGLEEGTHKVKVIAENSDGEDLTVSPKYIIVTISRE